MSPGCTSTQPILLLLNNATCACYGTLAFPQQAKFLQKWNQFQACLQMKSVILYKWRLWILIRESLYNKTLSYKFQQHIFFVIVDVIPNFVFPIIVYLEGKKDVSQIFIIWHEVAHNF